MVLGAEREGSFDGGSTHSVPVQSELLHHQLLLQTQKPLLAHSRDDLKNKKKISLSIHPDSLEVPVLFLGVFFKFLDF